LHAQDPAIELVKIKFFTSMIKGRLARLGADSVNAQDTYRRALTARGVEIILGSFTLANGSAPRYVAGVPADRDNRVAIWSLVEKQTDLRLALQIYRDVTQGWVDQIVLCSNDSDLSPVLEAIREDHPAVKIGVILPRKPDLQAKRSESLEKLAHWTRDHIRDEELQSSQFPDRVGKGKKPVDKPAHWRAVDPD